MSSLAVRSTRRENIVRPYVAETWSAVRDGGRVRRGQRRGQLRARRSTIYQSSHRLYRAGAIDAPTGRRRRNSRRRGSSNSLPPPSGAVDSESAARITKRTTRLPDGDGYYYTVGPEGITREMM